MDKQDSPPAEEPKGKEPEGTVHAPDPTGESPGMHPVMLDKKGDQIHEDANDKPKK